MGLRAFYVWIAPNGLMRKQEIACDGRGDFKIAK